MTKHDEVFAAWLPEPGNTEDFSRKPNLHPNNKLFPADIWEAKGKPTPSFQALVDDIRANGQREPIVMDLTTSGKEVALDGNRRWHACVMAGKKPKFEAWSKAKHGDRKVYILSRNLQRRHLEKSQRALIGARLVTTTHGGDRKSKNQEGNFTLENAATLVGVSVDLVKMARSLLAEKKKTGVTALIKQVESGKMSLNKALVEANINPDPQSKSGSTSSSKPKSGGSKTGGKAGSTSGSKTKSKSKATDPKPEPPADTDTSTEEDQDAHLSHEGEEQDINPPTTMREKFAEAGSVLDNPEAPSSLIISTVGNCLIDCIGDCQILIGVLDYVSENAQPEEK